jgi:hypothetical protein
MVRLSINVGLAIVLRALVFALLFTVISASCEGLAANPRFASQVKAHHRPRVELTIIAGAVTDPAICCPAERRLVVAVKCLWMQIALICATIDESMRIRPAERCLLFRITLLQIQ